MLLTEAATGVARYARLRHIGPQQNCVSVRERIKLEGFGLSSSKKPRLGHLIGELTVIVVGVMIALAADRWVAGLDDRGRERAYVAQLVENLIADSTQLAGATATAEAQRALAVGVLDGSVDTLLANPEAVLRSLERLGWWVPLDHSRETWDDLVSSGSLGLIRDPAVRQELSRYYNLLESLATFEQSWEEQLVAAAEYRLDIVPPLVRLRVAEALPHDSSLPRITRSDAESALRILREDPSHSGDVGNLALIYSAQASFYPVLVSQAAQLLHLLRGAL